MDETRITAELPNLTIAIDHRAEDGAETVIIRLTACPDFRQALPLADGMMQALPWLAPWSLWTRTIETMLAPWAAHLPPPRS
ncbi:hypothetical protein [Magnetospirillum moscoviense]|uniref:Uncharacterized protein n=1 Tax=Magnetospirillum moscoviense TaxID=1437059 RepID=A0A178ML60_9PROT|nr:hypothetical protein [Magnetospirillum moscoviense]MBF0323507.1 hypothetical protein [Alphaproteobacteria bacterium]OAN49461.1 hypothetical protein A6A05_13670 [Magnetospirillum moscoviense]